MSIFLKDGELLFGSHRRVIKTKEEAMNLFKEFHASPIGGHTGTLKTQAAICSRFYWYGMTVDIGKLVCSLSVHPLATIFIFIRLNPLYRD